MVVGYHHFRKPPYMYHVFSIGLLVKPEFRQMIRICFMDDWGIAFKTSAFLPAERQKKRR